MTPQPDADQRTRGIAMQLIGWAWVLTIGVTAVGHVTALRNTLTVAVSLATLAACLRDRRERPVWPCKSAVLALVLWATASVLWSQAPDVTLAKLRTDLYLPLLASLAIFCFVRRAGLRSLVAGLVCGLVALAALSLFAYLPAGIAPADWVLEQSAGIVRPLPHWYPGPGDASMFAVLAVAPLSLAWSASRERLDAGRRRALVVVAACLVAVVLVTTNNRNAILVAPLVLVFQWLLDRRTQPAGDVRRPDGRRRRLQAGAALVIGLVVVGSILEFGARERLAYLKRPLQGDSAAVELISQDTRPMIWRYYLARGIAHPWIGFGFGRTVPGIGMGTQADRALAAVEPNAYIHAHNMLINWWLQLGTIGVLLLGAVVASIVGAARALRDASGSPRRAARVVHTLYAIVLATLARNLTDDFLVYGMATAVGLCIAAMLGELSRLASVRTVAAAPVDADDDATAPRSPSAPS